jgi:hypothetical protein
MNISKSAAGLASALLVAASLTACGDVQDEGGNGGFAGGWQPGSYVPAPVHQVEGVDSGIRAALAKKAAQEALVEDGGSGQDRPAAREHLTNRFQHRFE